MPQLKLPTSKYLQVADIKKLSGEERLCKIKEAPTEASTNEDMLSCLVFNRILGEKIIYDYANKFKDFFDAYGDNSDAWVNSLLLPILPEKESMFFVRFEPVAFTVQNIE